MLVHILSLLDTLAAVSILMGHYGAVHLALLYAAVYLVIKLFFYRDWMSIIDTAAAAYCVYLFFNGHGTGLTWAFMIYFLYKMSVWVFYSFAD